MENEPQEFNIHEIKNQEIPEFKPKKPIIKFKFKKKYLRIGIVALLVVVIIFAAAAFYKGWFSFSKDKVNLEVVISKEVSSGEEIEFSVKYQNNNRVSLKDAKLTIDYPEGAYAQSGDGLIKETVQIGEILSKKGGVKNFKIRLAAEKGSVKLLTFKLDYQPANISSRFENSLSSKININSVLIEIYLAAPQKVINGEEIVYILDYINNIEQDFSDLRVELEYPTGFTFKTFDFQSATEEKVTKIKDNTFEIKELKKTERGSIRVLGILEGIEGENKNIKVSLGKVENEKFLKYSQTSAVTQISSSPLIVNLFLNDNTEGKNVNAKDVLKYKVEFKNNSDIPLSQLILKAYLQGEMFNFRSIKLDERGFFDSLNNIITWSAAGVPALALLPPGESGQVGFSLAVNENFPINNLDDKNFQVSVRIELETLNVPPQFSLEKLRVEKILNSKVNSKVVLKAKGYYYETGVGITNSGPIPPRVNQVTAYTIHWQITNTANDLEGAKVTAVLPEGVDWQNLYITRNNDTRVEYNERTKQIVWDLGKIPAAAGFLIPVYELVFQIAIRPSITQVDTDPTIIGESILEGKDAFTEENPQSSSREITTRMPDDPSVGQGGGYVKE